MKRERRGFGGVEWETYEKGEAWVWRSSFYVNVIFMGECIFSRDVTFVIKTWYIFVVCTA